MAQIDEIKVEEEEFTEVFKAAYYLWFGPSLGTLKNTKLDTFNSISFLDQFSSEMFVDGDEYSKIYEEIIKNLEEELYNSYFIEKYDFLIDLINPSVKVGLTII